MYRLFFKRFIDIILSIILILVTSPLILITALVLFINNRGNPFFIQIRPGMSNELFSIIKFKTMNDRKDSAGQLLSDELRLTTIGKVVRKLSIDELPQLFNVLIGHMSLIGPRPLLVEYLNLYNNTQKRRHEVRPGITGWAQINGRNTISWEEKFQLDVWYVDNLSFKLDFKILILTISKIFRQEGISSSTSVTMEKFGGTK